MIFYSSSLALWPHYVSLINVKRIKVQKEKKDKVEVIEICVILESADCEPFKQQYQKLGDVYGCLGILRLQSGSFCLLTSNDHNLGWMLYIFLLDRRKRFWPLELELVKFIISMFMDCTARQFTVQLITDILYDNYLVNKYVNIWMSVQFVLHA